MKCKLLLILLLLISVPVFSEINYPYYLYSENGKFFLKSIPHNDQSFEIEGRTDIYRSSDSSFLYSIPRYFNPDYIVISNDGLSILHAKYGIPPSQKVIDERLVLFYRKGELELTYNAGELIVEDSVTRFSRFFYHNMNLYDWDYEKGQRIFHDTVKLYMQYLIEDPFYSYDKMAYIATRDGELLTFSLRNGELISRTPLKEAESIINKTFNEQNIIKPEFDIPTQFGLPDLADGTRYEEAFAKEFNFTFDKYWSDSYKYYWLNFTCLIDSDGNCLNTIIDFDDPELNKNIEQFFLSTKFDPHEIPDIIEMFYFEGSSRYRKADEEIAKHERLIEKEEEHKEWLWRIAQDTIDGVYIPKDLDDCMKALDNLLSDRVKEEFKISDPIMAHFGLGLWLRNNWGLWGGSRLERYFASQLGITHPDSMSGTILDAYHAYLNGLSYDHFIQSHSPLKLRDPEIDSAHYKY